MLYFSVRQPVSKQRCCFLVAAKFHVGERNGEKGNKPTWNLKENPEPIYRESVSRVASPKPGDVDGKRGIKGVDREWTMKLAEER